MPSNFGGAPKCDKCGKSAYANESVTFNLLVFHEACFTCALCGTRMRESLATTVEGKAYHTQCAKKLKLEVVPKAKGSMSSPSSAFSTLLKPNPSTPSSSLVPTLNSSVPLAAALDPSESFVAVLTSPALTSSVFASDPSPTLLIKPTLTFNSSSASTLVLSSSPLNPSVIVHNADSPVIVHSSPNTSHEQVASAASASTSLLLKSTSTFAPSQLSNSTTIPSSPIISSPISSRPPSKPPPSKPTPKSTPASALLSPIASSPMTNIAITSHPSPIASTGVASFLSPPPTFSLGRTVSPDVAVISLPTPEKPSENAGVASVLSPLPTFSVGRTVSPIVSIVSLPTPAPSSSVATSHALSPPPTFSLARTETPAVAVATTLSDSPLLSAASLLNIADEQSHSPHSSDLETMLLFDRSSSVGSLVLASVPSHASPQKPYPAVPDLPSLLSPHSPSYFAASTTTTTSSIIPQVQLSHSSSEHEISSLQPGPAELYPDIPDVASPCSSPSKLARSSVPTPILHSSSSPFPPPLSVPESYPPVPSLGLVPVFSPEAEWEVKVSDLVPSSPSSFWSCNSSPASPSSSAPTASSASSLSSAKLVISPLPATTTHSESPMIAPTLMFSDHNQSSSINPAYKSPPGTFVVQRTTTPAVSVAPLYPTPPSPTGLRSPQSPAGTPMLHLRVPTPSSSESSSPDRRVEMTRVRGSTPARKLFDNEMSETVSNHEPVTLNEPTVKLARDLLQQLEEAIRQSAARATISGLQKELAEASFPAALHLAKEKASRVSVDQGSAQAEIERNTYESQLLGEMSLIAVITSYLDLEKLLESQIVTLSPSHWNLLLEQITDLAINLGALLEHAIWWQQEEVTWLAANESHFQDDVVRCSAQLAILQMIHAKVRLVKYNAKHLQSISGRRNSTGNCSSSNSNNLRRDSLGSFENNQGNRSRSSSSSSVISNNNSDPERLALQQEVGNASLAVAQKLSKLDLSKISVRSPFSLEGYLKIAGLAAAINILSTDRRQEVDKVAVAQLETVSVQCADAATVAAHKLYDALQSAVQLSEPPPPLGPSSCPLDLLQWVPTFSAAIDSRVQALLNDVKRLHPVRGEVCVMSCRVLGRMIHDLETQIERAVQSQSRKTSVVKMQELLGGVGRKFGAMCVQAALWKQEQLPLLSKDLGATQELANTEEHIGALSCEGARYLLHELGVNGSSSASGESANAIKRALSRQLSELSVPASHWLARETKHLEHLLGQGESESLRQALERTKADYSVLQVIALRQRVMRFVVRVSERSLDGVSIRKEAKRLNSLSHAAVNFLTTNPSFFASAPPAYSTISSISPALSASSAALRWLMSDPHISVSSVALETSLIRFSMPRWTLPSAPLPDPGKLQRMEICAQAALWHRIEVYMLQTEFAALGLRARDQLTSAIACSAAEIGAALVEGSLLGLNILQSLETEPLSEQNTKLFRISMMLLFYCFSFMNPVPSSSHQSLHGSVPAPSLTPLVPDLSSMLRVVVNMTPNLHDLEPLRVALAQPLHPALAPVSTLAQLIALRGEIGNLKTKSKAATGAEKVALEELLWEAEAHLGEAALKGLRDREEQLRVLRTHSDRGEQASAEEKELCFELAEFRVESLNYTLPFIESLTRTLDQSLTTTRRQEIIAELEDRKRAVAHWSISVAKWALRELDENTNAEQRERAEDLLASVSFEARSALVAEKQALRVQLKGDRSAKELREAQHYCEQLTIHCAKYKAQEIEYLSDLTSAGEADEEYAKTLCKSREEFVSLSWDATVYCGKQLETLTRRFKRHQMGPQGSETVAMRRELEKCRDNLALMSCQAADCRLFYLAGEAARDDPANDLLPDLSVPSQLSFEALRTQVGKLYQKYHMLWQEQITKLTSLLTAPVHEQRTLLLQTLMRKFEIVSRDARVHFAETQMLSRRGSTAAPSIVSSQPSQHSHHHHDPHSQSSQHHQQQQQQQQQQVFSQQFAQRTPSIQLAQSSLDFKTPSLDFARAKQDIYPSIPSDTPFVHALYAQDSNNNAQNKISNFLTSNPSSRRGSRPSAGRRNSVGMVTVHKDAGQAAPSFRSVDTISPNAVQMPATVSPITARQTSRKPAEDALEQGIIMWNVSDVAPLHLTFAKLACSDHGNSSVPSYSIHWVPRTDNATAAFGLMKDSKAYFGPGVIKHLGLNRRVLEAELGESKRCADWLFTVVNPDGSNVILLCMSGSDFDLWMSRLSDIISSSNVVVF